MGKTLIRVDCIDQRLYIAAAPAVASGGKNEDAVEFSFCPLWDGFGKTAVFYRSENDVYHAIVTDDRCIIPHEVLKDEGTLYFGVFGVKGDTTRTSEIARYRVAKGAITEGTNPSDPTPDIYAQIMGKYADLNTRLNRLEEGGGSPGEPGKDGENGGYYTPTVTPSGALSWTASKTGMPSIPSTNIRGPVGKDGHTPVRGEDYWTDDDQADINATSLNYITTELAKRGQLKPEFANSIEECTDTSLLYVLPDGYIYGYMKGEFEVRINVLKEVGYTQGMRFDETNGVIAEANQYGSAITGYIPCKPDDVIHIRNMDIPDTYHGGKFWNWVCAYDSNKACIKSEMLCMEYVHVGGQLIDGKSENGMVTQFTMKETHFGPDVAYIIICAKNITDESEVYVNPRVETGWNWANTGHAFVPADYEDRIVVLEKFAEDIEETVNDVIEKAETFDYSAYGLPVIRFTGDVSAMTKDNAVTLEYVYGERSGNCTLKWQGNSSLSYPKKNYTIKFDNAFEAAAGWGEQKKYCLKANFMEFSHSRNICSARLWGQIVKSRKNKDSRLESLPNYGAVDGFPIVIVINDKYEGLYTFNIPKDAWMFGMGSGAREAILCADYSDQSSQGTRFNSEVVCDGSDFEIEYVPDKNNAAWAVESINTLIRAVMASDGTDIDTVIAKYVDIDSAIDYLLFTPLVQGCDMLVKNYILATYDGVKWFFSAYDMDSTFGLSWHAGYYGDVNGKAFNPAAGDEYDEWPVVSSMATHKLFKLLIENKSDAIKARYAELRAGAMSEANVAHEFNEFAAMIPKPYFDKEPTLWPTIPATSANNANQIVTHYMMRTRRIDADVNGLA